jgi:hypothetical protein
MRNKKNKNKGEKIKVENKIKIYNAVQAPSTELTGKHNIDPRNKVADSTQE